MTGLGTPDDLGPVADEVAGVARELEAYARGTAHAVPPELMPRVLAAVAREAPPTPPVGFARAIAALAPRDAARAFGAMLALVEGRRPGGPGLRLRAAAMVMAIILLVGSAAAGATLGGARLAGDWLGTLASPSTAATDVTSPTPARTSTLTTPTPDDRSPHSSAHPGDSAEPHGSAEPSGSAESAEPSEKDDGRASDDPGDGPSPSNGGERSGDGGHSPEPTGGD